LIPEGAELIAYKWRGWAKRSDPEYLPGDSRDPVFANEDDFRASVITYVAEHWPAIEPGTKSFETVTGFARGECTIEKSNRTSATANSISNLVGYQAPTLSESPHRFSELIDDWALERDPKRKTRDEFDSKVTKLVATVPVVWTASGANKQRPVAG
jgi:hypothetical protein